MMKSIPGMKTSKIKKTMFVFAAFFFHAYLLAQPHYSSEIELEKVRLVVNDAASWQIKNMPARGRTPQYNPQYTGWADGTFLGALAYWSEYDNSRNFVEWYENLAKELRWEVGHRSFNPANDIAVALMYAKIWERNPLPRYLDAGKAKDRAEFLELLAGGWDPLIPTLERLDYQMKTYPDEDLLKQFPEAISETWSWPDALYMAAPVYSIFANITGDNKYREFMDREFWATVSALYDEEEKLFHQEEGSKHLREPNGKKMFWGRGNGWVIGALSLVIDLLPEDHPTLPQYRTLFKEMMQRVTSLQQESGFWHSSMLDPESYPDPEASATGFFTFGLWWGINNGLLSEEEYLQPAVKAWKALVSTVHSDGMVGHVQSIGGRPALEVPSDASEVYGTGAFMLAGLEICKFLEARKER